MCWHAQLHADPAPTYPRPKPPRPLCRLTLEATLDPLPLVGNDRLLNRLCRSMRDYPHIQAIKLYMAMAEAAVKVRTRHAHPQGHCNTRTLRHAPAFLHMAVPAGIHAASM